ncbi:nucleoside 2-deoxyribosyltransferase [Patescibacteria group bacterium]|nr:nucleoside 2-deoxyribosyltransferase [Patescibacteria group bacterium]
MSQTKLKIYFAGAVLGGRHDQEWYQDIIGHLKNYGQVLTAQIGDADLIHRESKLEDKNIYDALIVKIKKADLLIAEVSTPSLGVGYEVAYAERIGKPVLCLFRNGKGRQLSAMINGNHNVDLVRYDKLKDVLEAIDEFFEENYG